MAGQHIATHGLSGLGFLRCCRGWLYVSLVSEDIPKPYSQTEICTLEAGAEEEILLFLGEPRERTLPGLLHVLEGSLVPG